MSMPSDLNRFGRRRTQASSASSHAIRNLMRSRTESGVYLIEFLVALVVSTLIAGFLIDDISQIHRFSSKGEKQLVASAIGQEVIDNARDTSFTNLRNLVASSPHTLLINTGDGDGTIDPAFPRPLLLDLQNLTWSQQSQNGRFLGTVTETLADNATYPWLPPNTIMVQVQIQWTEDGGTQRTYTVSTLISQFGIHS